jgi:hypothetical protein
MAPVTLDRREAAAIRRLLRDIGHGVVSVHRTMEARDLQVIAWLLWEATRNGALPQAKREAADDGCAYLEARIGQHVRVGGDSRAIGKRVTTTETGPQN